jgi:Rrf2 family transcriptional regulator, cysteine metabolism repressor
MKIPTMLRYGVRMVVTLAQKGEVMSTAGLAKEMGVSPLYLRQLAPVLERAGIIEGFRGARGGYRLKVRPEEITLFEIIQAFDEDFSLLDCIKSAHSCARSPDCTTRYLWKDLSDMLRTRLQAMTLKELMEKKNNGQYGRAIGWAEYTI